MKKFLKSKKNVFKHYPEHPSFPDVAPAKNFAPDFYKKTQSTWDTENFEKNSLPLPLTFKACSSYGDSFLSGYSIPLALDIAVRQTEGGPSISWHNQDPSVQPVTLRDHAGNSLLPTPSGMSSLHFVWNTKHYIKVPKGYSALMTHPLNRYDLPFLTLSGIVDGEISLHAGQVPVYFNTTFEGIIPAGTPIMQVLLFKTENWTNEKDPKVKEDGLINGQRSQNAAFGWYKKNIWKKKMYM